MDVAKNQKIYLSGHTDSDGKDKMNRDLSQRRIQRIVEVLNNSGYVNIFAKSFGESQPIADNSTQQNRLLNRRVEMFFYKQVCR